MLPRPLFVRLPEAHLRLFIVSINAHDACTRKRLEVRLNLRVNEPFSQRRLLKELGGDDAMPDTVQ
jgi:hypothetical protein